MNRPKRSTAGVAGTVALLAFLATARAAKNDRTATGLTESAPPTVVAVTTIVTTTSDSARTTSTSSLATTTSATLGAPIPTDAVPNPAKTVLVRVGEGWLALAESVASRRGSSSPTTVGHRLTHRSSATSSSAKRKPPMSISPGPAAHRRPRTRPTPSRPRPLRWRHPPIATSSAAATHCY